MDETGENGEGEGKLVGGREVGEKGSVLESSVRASERRRRRRRRKVGGGRFIQSGSCNGALVMNWTLTLSIFVSCFMRVCEHAHTNTRTHRRVHVCAFSKHQHLHTTCPR